jgi:hypothetical protein
MEEMFDCHECENGFIQKGKTFGCYKCTNLLTGEDYQLTQRQIDEYNEAKSNPPSGEDDFTVTKF